MTIAQEIVELFEDFLESRGVYIPNEDRDADGDPDAAILYGMDYAELVDDVEDMLQKWMRKDIVPHISDFLGKVVTEE